MCELILGPRKCCFELCTYILYADDAKLYTSKPLSQVNKGITVSDDVLSVIETWLRRVDSVFI